MAYSKCGMPTIQSLIDTDDNMLMATIAMGNSGNDNMATGVEVFITCDGSTPSLTNYKYSYRKEIYSVESGKNIVYQVIPFAGLSDKVASELFGEDCVCTIKLVARTVGQAGIAYYSDITSVKSCQFVWHSRARTPRIVAPSYLGEVIGDEDYIISWEPSSIGINNSISGYKVVLYNKTQNKIVQEIYTSNTAYTFDSNAFTYSNDYVFHVTPDSYYLISDDSTATSGVLKKAMLNKFNSDELIISASDGGTVPSIDIFDGKTYIDIGSGNVLKLSWALNHAAGINKVDHYNLTLQAFNVNTGISTELFSNNIGNINEFYITSDLLSKIDLVKYELRVYLEAKSIYGEKYSCASDVLIFNIAKGCGIYTKVNNGNGLIMKRSVALAKLKNVALKDAEGKAIKAADGTQLYAKSASVQNTSSCWALMQEFYSKVSDEVALLDASGRTIVDANGRAIYIDVNTWLKSDIEYEVLYNLDGEIITDIEQENIYVL